MKFTTEKAFEIELFSDFTKLMKRKRENSTEFQKQNDNIFPV
jgi:hypothetical protein